MSNPTLGTILREHRERLGFTITQVEYLTGISRHFLISLEADGIDQPSKYILLSLCYLYNIKITDLFSTAEEKEKKALIPPEAVNIHVFHIKGDEVFVGFYLPNGDFHFVQIPYKPKEKDKTEETIPISKEPDISKEKILEKHIISGKEDSYGYGSSQDIVVSPPQNIYAAMQEYLYLKTAVKDKEIAELKEALIYLMKGVEGLPPLSAIEGVLIPHFKKAKETIEKYS